MRVTFAVDRSGETQALAQRRLAADVAPGYLDLDEAARLPSAGRAADELRLAVCAGGRRRGAGPALGRPGIARVRGGGEVGLDHLLPGGGGVDVDADPVGQDGVAA